MPGSPLSRIAAPIAIVAGALAQDDDDSHQHGQRAGGHLVNTFIPLVRRHPLVAFFGLAYSISWAIWIPMVAASIDIGSVGGGVLNAIAIAGPSIAALLIAAGLGSAQLRDLVAGLSLARMPIRWAVIALGLPLVMIANAIASGVAFFGTPAPIFSIGLVGIMLGEFVRILFLGGPLGEELGWRGFALPRLQARRTAFDASVLLGVIWGLWHIPLYFVSGTGQFETLNAGTDPAFAIGGFVGWTIGLSVLFTWLINETRGSLLVVILFHASVNLAVYLPAALGSTGIVSLLNVAVTWLVALLVAVRVGRATLAASPKHTTPDEGPVPTSSIGHGTAPR
jgi:membrane protease YdiL (CAAX protease family)